MRGLDVKKESMGKRWGMKKEFLLYALSSSYIFVYYALSAWGSYENPLVFFYSVIGIGSFLGLPLLTHLIIPLVVYQCVYMRKSVDSIFIKRFYKPGFFIITLVGNFVILHFILVAHVEVTNHMRINETFPQGLPQLKHQVEKELREFEGNKIRILQFEIENPYFMGSALGDSGIREELTVGIIYEKNNQKEEYRQSFNMETGIRTKIFSSVRNKETRKKEMKEKQKQEKQAILNYTNNLFQMNNEEIVEFIIEPSVKEKFEYEMTIMNVKTKEKILVMDVERLIHSDTYINEMYGDILEYRGKKVKAYGSFSIIASMLEIVSDEGEDVLTFVYYGLK